MKLHHLTRMVMAIAGSAGLAHAEETTMRVYRQGTSTTTITQSGSEPTTSRRIIHGRDGQTIIQQQGDTTVTVTQRQGSNSAVITGRQGNGNKIVVTQGTDEGGLEEEDLDELEEDDWW